MVRSIILSFPTERACKKLKDINLHFLAKPHMEPNPRRRANNRTATSYCGWILKPVFRINCFPREITAERTN